MLKDMDAVATIAVKELDAADRFYSGTLGLEQVSADSQVIVYASGKTRLFVYKSQYAGTNQATSVNWMAGDDVERIAKDLAAKGIPFERYDMPGMSHDGPVHVMGDFKVAWFKDPDGNILSLVRG